MVTTEDFRRLLSQTPLQTAQQAIQLLHTSNEAVAASGTGAWSGWKDLNTVGSLLIGRTATGGAPTVDIEWSRDGAAGDFIENVAPANNTTVEKRVAARWARFRVRNTDAVNALAGHRTNVYGR